MNELKHCFCVWLVEKVFKKMAEHALTLFHIIQSYIQSGLEACRIEDSGEGVFFVLFIFILNDR